MKVLIIGSGGREHTIAWKVKQSPKVSEIWVAPGNPGISKLANIVDIKADDIENLLKFAYEQSIDLTIVGPEVPLVKGIVNTFEAHDLKIFGPNRYAAQFEASKAFSKAFMDKYHIPTARYREFTEISSAEDNLHVLGYPLVIKADGLAAGKGVVICQNEEEAKKTLKEMMLDEKFGRAGRKVVFEEFLEGVEASVLCFMDSKTIMPMASAQDYKKAFDGDKGLNTGGMGAYSPSVLMTETLEKTINEEVLQPFLKGVQSEGINYRGVLFVGLMLKEGHGKVVEFNCRMGDPETQAILPRMENDLMEVLEACIDQTLEDVTLKWKEEACVSVVLASSGYPEVYEKDKPITGLENLEKVLVFHGGTKEDKDRLLTSGGRVLNITGLAPTLKEARKNVYNQIDKISYEGMMYRKDIGEFDDL
jgi:phosphoribosylamine--glycine ligase